MEIVTLKVLREHYLELLEELGIENREYRTEKVKTRMVKKFGSLLHFWHPSNRAQSEIVYCDALPKGKLIEETYSETMSTNEESVDDEDFMKEDSNSICRKDFYDSDRAYIIYHSAKMLRSVLSEVSTMIPWPPSASDISEANISIPNLTYNFLAWTLVEDVDSSPVSEKRVVLPSTTEQKVFSFGQDLIYAVNNGRVLTPKHIALPLSVKNWTGSAEVVMTLNKFGHGISYTALEELETAMAEKQIRHQSSGCVLPSNIVPGVFSIFCYDNNDLQEETLNGKGTTHCTNGIVIQRQTHGCHLQPDEKEKKGSQKK